MNTKKIKVGMRISTRREGTGTIVRSNGGHGWIVKFDNYDWNGPIWEYNIWSEDGNIHSDEF